MSVQYEQAPTHVRGFAGLGGQEVVATAGSESSIAIIDRHWLSKAHETSQRHRFELRWRSIKSRLRSGSLTPVQAVVETCRAIESFETHGKIFEEPILFVLEQKYLLWENNCCDEKEREKSYPVLAGLVQTLQKYCIESLVQLVSPQLRVKIAEFFVKVGFSEAAVVAEVGDEWLSEVQPLPKCLCPISYRDFQMLHMGHLMQRNVRFDPDPRVTSFIPDTWQRELLDLVDRRESAVIVAPTSSGKTYCSYYCMRKVLEMSDDSIVVYVAPTKALVNQVHASIIAKLSKPGLKPERKLCGVFTRDYSYFAQECQILVTVPQCLELLLLSPRCQGWASRIQYVILDEVHCIGMGIGGVVWEYLICLMRCPFLALSATIHNREYFHDWLQTVKTFTKSQDEAATAGVQQGELGTLIKTGYKVNLVTYSERYSDIRTSVYLPSSRSIVEVNPCVFLNAKLLTKNGFPNSLKLSPKEAHEVWSAAVERFQGDQEASSVLEKFSPDAFFSTQPISRVQFRDYETRLKQAIYELLKDKPQKSQELLDTLKLTSSGASQSEPLEDIDADERKDPYHVDILGKFPYLIDNIRSAGGLPALVFLNSRSGAKLLAKSLIATAKKKIDKLGLFDDAPDPDTLGSDSSDSSDGSTSSSLSFSEFNVGYRDLIRHRSQIVECAYFSLGAVSEEVDQVFAHVVAKIEDESVKRMLVLGVGYHHAGCVTKHRQAVEMLFRYGYLQVVVSTATLALGIHMPCKTVVFAGDDKFLNALNYHQMSGRSGRRGFDSVGDMVFYGVPASKIGHLIQADLPKLRGGFPMTCAFALRLLLLTGNATDREAAHAQAITVLNHPFAAHKSHHIMEQLKLYFLFSVEFLRHRELINHDGVPQKLAGLVCEIAHHEPGNFVLAHLLRTRALRELCQPVPHSARGKGKRAAATTGFSGVPSEAMRQLVLVLCHLFTNYPAPKSLVIQRSSQVARGAENTGSLKDKDYETGSRSMVLLDPLPSDIAEAVSDYNERTVCTYVNYLKCVTGCGLFEFSRRLPMSGATPLGDGASDGGGFSAVSPLTRLSMCLKATGWLCESENRLEELLHRVILENNWQQLRWLLPQEILADCHQIPVLPAKRRLNAYALDFFNHGSIRLLELHNGIQAGDVYALLEDFKQVIKTVHAVLNQINDRQDPVLLAFEQVTRQFDEKFKKAFFPQSKRRIY